MANNFQPAISTFPGLPDPKEYEHLTEEERMIQGFPHRYMDSYPRAFKTFGYLYRPLHKELRAKKFCTSKLLQRFNQTEFDDEKTRRGLLNELLHPSCNGKNIFVKQTFRCNYGYNIKVGNNFYANFDCTLLDSSLIEFGDDCMLGPRVQVYTATHPLNAAFRKLSDSENYFELAAPIRVGNNCWLGGSCILCPGITLGDNVIVGAGAVVTKSFPNNVVIAGNPAKVIKKMVEPIVPSASVWRDEAEMLLYGNN